jgi:spermidine synthase
VPIEASRAARVWPSILAFASGYLCFAVEVVATHLLAVVIGSSAYAFGLILAAFLMSLFAGASFAPAFARRFSSRALATSLSLTALAMAATLPFWDALPLAFAGLGEYVTSFEGREAMRALVAFAILVFPATAMGLTFPLLLRQAAAHADVGAFVGRLTAINTVGAVTGALLTGYVVLPLLGSEGTLIATAAVFAVLGLSTALLTNRDVERSSPRAPIGIALAAAVVCAFAPRWDLGQLTLGTNVYFDGQKPPDSVLTVREDVHGGMTTVTLRDAVHTLYTNGKFQGNDGWELHAQRYFAHYPCLFVPEFRRALVIGLGTGTTLGTLTAYPWQRIDLLEISPSIVEAARTYFAGPNRDALHDPRVHLTLDDARNHLLVHEGRYDLIGMELSSVWFAGASSLYSSEYYRLVKAHLEPDGVFQQWVQMHHIYPPVFGTLVNTLRKEFEHVALFYGGGQGILVASPRPLRWSVERARRLTASFRDVEGILPNERSLDALTLDVLLTGEGLDRFIEDTARVRSLPRGELVSTDDNLYLEYETPRGNVLPWEAREALVATLRTYSDPDAVAALAVTLTGKKESSLSR